MKKIKKDIDMKIITTGRFISPNDVPKNSLVLFESDSSMGRWSVPVQVKGNVFILAAFSGGHALNRWNDGVTYTWDEIMNATIIKRCGVINRYLFESFEEMCKFITNEKTNN